VPQKVQKEEAGADDNVIGFCLELKANAPVWL
jgi:hypothetical protein